MSPYSLLNVFLASVPCIVIMSLCPSPRGGRGGGALLLHLESAAHYPVTIRDTCSFYRLLLGAGYSRRMLSPTLIVVLCYAALQ